MITLRWDSVSLMQKELRDVQFLGRWLAAMKAGRWRSKDIPSHDVLQDGDDWFPAFPKRKTRAMYWEVFAFMLHQKMRPVLPSVSEPGAGGLPMPIVFSATLLDAIYLRLRDQVSTKDQTARLCAGCRGIFFVSISNDKRIYCSTRCKNRVNVARYRRKMRR